MSKLLTTEKSINIILDPELTPNCICKRLPIGVNCNSIFLVDMCCLANPKDIVCDDMGSWRWGGSYRVWLKVNEFGGITVLGKDLPKQKSDDFPFYRIWKRYYVNKSSPDLKKLIVTIEGKQECTYKLLQFNKWHGIYK